MQEYEIRKGFQENLQPGKLKSLMQETFGNVLEKDGRFVSSFGALKELSAWPSEKRIAVETKTDPSVGDDVAQNTIRAYNTFLEKATGYTAKERGKRAQKKAKEGKP
jgi:hypothetical protein